MLGLRLSELAFEQGPIRPPSEAYSLLIRATRNCPWNRCTFCSTYKGQKFELRTTEDILNDIETARTIADEIKTTAWKTGNGSRLKDVAATIYNQPQYNYSIRNVALWLWAGGERVFLQDANSLIMKTPDLVTVLSALKQTFPQVNRITTYARSKTAAKKSVEELKQFKDAGLSRIHIGLESGADVVLAYVQKGVTAEEHIRGGRNIKEAGISLSEYIMPGLGGKKMSAEHVNETARVLNAIDPDFIRLRTLHVRRGMPLQEQVDSGDFEMQTDDAVVAEIGSLIEKLEVTSYLASDHIMNLLPEIEGRFPEVKTKCLDAIRRYLALPTQEKLNYRLGRRANYYEKLDDLYDAHKHQMVDKAIKRITEEANEDIDDLIRRLAADSI